MTRDEWRRQVYRDDWDRISDDERARRIEDAMRRAGSR